VTGQTRLAVVGALAAGLSVLPLGPVTENHGWTVSAAMAIALVAATGLVLRRIHAPRLLVPVAQLVVLVWWLGVLVASDVAWFVVIPNLAWAERLVTVFGDGLDQIAQYAAPAPVERGILLLLVGGAGLVGLLVDLFAVELRRVPLAGVALGAVYAVAASVAPGGLSWIWFVPPAAGFLALLVAEGRTRVVRWGRSAGPSATHTGIPETDSLARNGRRVGTVAIAAAVVLPAILPGLTEGIFGNGGGSGGGSGREIRTDNPIVDLKGELELPDDVVMLTYTTEDPTPGYIRRAVLDVFNGEEWKTSNREVPEAQRVARGMGPPPGLTLTEDPPRTEFRFEVDDDNYGSKWLPLPYPAAEIDIEGDWRYDRPTLDVVPTDGDAGGATYAVQRLDVALSAERLRTAGPPSEEIDDMLALPDDLPREAVDWAERFTASATTAFDKAAALQARFRTLFKYELQTEPGTSSSDLVNFLDNQEGYCEQFAAAMAITARIVGIPARVAVGYLQGEQQEDGRWVVRANEAHAWPELYFEGTGWVAFEPTPAIRTGNQPAWTIPPDDGGTGDGSGAQPPGGAAPPGSADGLDPGLQPGDLGGPAGTGDASGQSSLWRVVAISIGVVALIAASPTVVARTRRGLRWRRAGRDPVRAAEAAWSDLRDTVRDAGFDWNPAATPRGTGRELATAAGLDEDSRDLLVHLVTSTERARYSTTPADAEGLREDSAMLRRTLLRSRSLGQRISAALWPSATSDVVMMSANRVADALDWTDLASQRMRQRAGRLLPGRR
jgi:transglutaminase-like putative cysteine protease